jgi:nitrogen fixation protein NifU and related proteins
LKYSDEVLRRVREPQRVGALPAGPGVGSGVSGTLDEGTVTRIDVRIHGNLIVEARFKVFGCSAAIASASLVAEWLEGASLEAAKSVTAERVVEALQLAEERQHVARMAVTAAIDAIASAAEVRSEKSEVRSRHDRNH